ncbi:MAG: phytase [Gammaproteobacteria bacterium]|nr:phytase [Gammaproteobacteria bacterium]MBU2277272.1 phytase [Gammaproteobacteria bacterium]MBU2427395.1 phytase [Gammaproteobacteria bacterium]
MKKLIITAAISSALLGCGAQHIAANNNHASTNNASNSAAANTNAVNNTAIITATAKNAGATLPPLTLLPTSAHHFVQAEVAGQQLQFVLDQRGLKVLAAAGAANQQLLASVAGNFVRLTSQPLDDGSLLLAAMEADTQSLHLWLWQNGQLQSQLQQAINSRVVEDLCFYHSGPNQQLSLFLLGGRGGADQLLLQQGGQWLKKPVVIREIAVPYDSKACAVDAHNGALYVSEPNAIWRYQAEPEADESRELLQVKQPFGAINSEIVALSVLPNGHVLALEEQPARLLQIPVASEKTAAGLSQPSGQSWPLGDEEVAAMSVVTTANITQVFVTSEHPATVQQWTLPAAAMSTPVAIKPVKSIQQVQPTAQSQAASQRGDVIDDPAIWHHPTKPELSRILATDKRMGLDVYDMAGKRLQQLAVGRLNNVDVRYNLAWKGKPHDVAVASLRNNNSLQLFAIAPDGRVNVAGQIPTSMQEIYGLCLFQPTAAQIYVFVNDKSGLVEQYQLHSDGQSWSGQKVRSLQVKGQPEGCVADDKRQQLYVGEEDTGIWRFDAAADAPVTGEQIILVDGAELVDDVEGLAFAPGETPYLLASSQGDDSYVLYQGVAPYRQLLKFRVTTNPTLGIDGSSETDGLDLTVRSLGPGFEQGALIVQDGRNRMPEQGQNLKYVPWQAVLDLLKTNNN